MAKTPHLNLEVTNEGQTSFAAWQQSLNGVGEGSNLSNAQIVDGWAGEKNTQLQELNSKVQNIEARGRFLALWNASTGKPNTDPISLPYTYKTGDYYILDTVVAGTHYKPNGLTYTGEASTTVEEAILSSGNEYWFDGAAWMLKGGTISLPDPPTTVGTTNLYCTVGEGGVVSYYWG